MKKGRGITRKKGGLRRFRFEHGGEEKKGKKGSPKEKEGEGEKRTPEMPLVWLDQHMFAKYSGKAEWIGGGKGEGGGKKPKKKKRRKKKRGGHYPFTFKKTFLAEKG